jgi:LysR family transcriptional regulator (chromosome initiation inhibitor)
LFSSIRVPYVRLDSQQLAAFAAVIEEGSFDAAARRLHITPSAISQRIKALEQSVGQVLVRREKPAAPTSSALPLVRVAAQMALLEAEALAELSGGDSAAARIALAVNADSMATWFTGVFDNLGDDVLVEIRIEDQEHSARLLREGAAMGAVTTERQPVPGCRVHPLGAMRYVPVASRRFVERCFREGFTRSAVAHAPVVSWNRDDALQEMFVRKVFRRDVATPVHYVPTVEGNIAAIRAGLGWGMYPDMLARGKLVKIHHAHLDVPLYWQCWKLDSPLVDRITEIVRSAASGLKSAVRHHDRPDAS